MAPKTQQMLTKNERPRSRFIKKGYSHAGINEVIANSDVVKRTFYKHSKDKLILEVMPIEKAMAVV